ncbi:unnamed protein product [Arabis nemorensis]|uniref:RBR-type E3 ubiquitin transferase n=1 Tax=Arabis nemorensis TaxID=586526 RepID=A0A565C9R9_9BRAS|nr:unnamed protein product [Arabis nemorensis]
MDEYLSAEEEDCYYSSDQETFDGIANDEEPVSSSSRRSTTQVITQESLLAAQREDLQKVMELMSVKEHHARTLLIHYQWDVDKLFAVFVEKGKDSLFSGAGVTVFDNQYDDSSFSHDSVMSCDVCIEEVPGDQMTRMECGHCFCNDCWTEHFTVQINEGQSKRIRCMAHKCIAICDEDVVRNLVSKRRPDLAEKFDRFLLESYIEDNRMVKWCPSTPHCGNAIRAEHDKLCEVECFCGLQFCFSCLSQAHSPCSCLMWELWRKKCRDESETVNWITVHTKLCPKCFKPVEKNGGCNLVRCICGQCFCWLCGGATGSNHTTRSIAGHSCGRYDDKKRQMERAKRDLNRYTHYHHRYKAHTDSSKLEDKLRGTILKKVSKSEKKELKLKDFSWVTNGLNRLFRSRRILSYSYAFAYYMFGEELFKDEMSPKEKEIKKNLFEDQQQQLEGNVEKLSQLLETPFDTFSDEKVMDVRIQIINLSVAVDNLCKKMYECIENDLLGSLQRGIHSIAPYKSKGVEQAAEFYASWNSKGEDGADKFQPLDCGTSGGTSKIEQASGSRNSEDTISSSSNKRPKKEGAFTNNKATLLDLNLPPDFIDQN